MTDEIVVERRIAADATTLWALVSDVTRMGEWSPETTGCRWLGGATGPTVGARFRGRNQRGWRVWSTTCTVVEADPGRSFTFDVTTGPLPVARWSYRFDGETGGCAVRETWTDRRSGLVKQLGWLASGVRDRADHNRKNMVQTLDRLAAVAENDTAVTETHAAPTDTPDPGSP